MTYALASLFMALQVADWWTTPFASIALALACAVYVGVIIWNYKRGSK